MNELICINYSFGFIMNHIDLVELVYANTRNYECLSSINLKKKKLRSSCASIQSQKAIDRHKYDCCARNLNMMN